MKIYTKTGDKGETSLHGGRRVPKDNVRIDAYGQVDELNSWIGLVRSGTPAREIDEILSRIQNDLFVLGSDLATPQKDATSDLVRIGPEHITFLETIIDNVDSQLEPLRSFILPGGSEVAGRLHIARTVCRRAERAVTRLSKSESIGSSPLVYMNRLADLLFVLARFANKLSSTPESPWSSSTPPRDERGG